MFWKCGGISKGVFGSEDCRGKRKMFTDVMLDFKLCCKIGLRASF